MSLKSFDKMCERMITGERQKEIFDERQKQIQGHLIAQSLIIFGAMVFVNDFVCDFWRMWSETQIMPHMLFAMIATIIYAIRAAAKGCCIGVNGEKSRKMAAISPMFIGGIYLIRESIDMLKNGFSVTEQGVVTDSFIVLLLYPTLIFMGIFTFIVARKAEKENNTEEEEKN